jgi:tRNA 5-methylaminomethyl-2-thiouridine biosynthesis bifunctional protein
MPHHDALVIGAGLAGSSVAWSLAQRGLNIVVLEQHEEPANEASGNPAGIYMPVLESAPSLKEAFYTDALCLLQQRLAEDSEKILHDPCGVIHIPRDKKQAQRFQRIIQRDDLTPHIVRPLIGPEAEHISGIRIPHDGLFYPDCGWVSPQSLCRHYLSHPRITLRSDQRVISMEHHNGAWHALNTSGEVLASSTLAVLASGHQSATIAQAGWLPFHSVRGQITQLMLNSPHRLKCVLCHQGYVLPATEKKLIIGATYNREHLDYEPTDDEHDQNIHALQQFLPDFIQDLDIQPTYQGRVGFRSVLPGRLPVAGQLMPAQAVRHKHPLTFFKGLAITAGHASRGILSSGIAAEMVAGDLLGEPTPYDKYRKLLSPARYLRHV